ncbi:MAG: hypothetical protein JST17_04590 [Bacteroidetes bacterium]|nr:hypothetical protein [Bacteroidota bacterium]MBS1929687.1 hypothetical protein [Bacteroidota bacterium]
MRKLFVLISLMTGIITVTWSQDTLSVKRIDTTHNANLPVHPADSVLRIINLNPFFNQHVDSLLSYQFMINRDPSKYYWYLKNSPAGLKINKDNGLLTFKAEKSYFLSGKLKYDVNYKVNIGVQSLTDPKDMVDTSFTLVFYNTEIIPSKVKPTVGSTLTIDEGDTVSFKIQCETGSFPIEDILFSSSIPIKNFSLVKKCDDEFRWSPDYDFVKDSDPGKQKTVTLSFIGSNKFREKDTALVTIIVNDALNYPMALEDYKLLTKNISTYILQLKYTFLQLDKKLKKNKKTRTTFDMTGASTALTGTILSTSSNQGAQNTGKILPSVGISLVPIKEAIAPAKIVDQNQAALVRTSIKRLEYMLTDNALVGDRDPDIVKKTNKLRDELKQIQVQLIDIPIDFTNNMTEEELNRYFNSPKVNKKYRLKGK